jgi:hypothetical protein
MSRLKPLFIAVAVGAALLSLVRNRMTDTQPVDAGGWKPVDPT